MNQSLVCLVSVLLAVLVVGCGEDLSNEPFTIDPTPIWGESQGNAQRGRRLALANCTPCHKVEGRGKRLAGAPPFAQTVAREDIDTAWLRLWIKNPIAQKPKTRMPDLGLRDDEIRHIIAFLYQLREKQLPKPEARGH